MTQIIMTQEDFTRLVETYGAKESRWPDEYRAQMQAFAADNAEAAKAVLEDEALLDTALDSVRAAPGTDMLKARILNNLPQHTAANQPEAPRSKFSMFGQKAVAALMLLAFTVGFTGASFLKLPGSGDDAGAVYASNEWEELATDYGMDDIFEWVGVPEDSPAP